MRRILLIAAVAALVAAPASLALDPAQTRALVRVAVQLSGLRERTPVRLVVEQPARFERRRVALLDRAYPRAQVAYDARVYRALGLAPAGTDVVRRTWLAVHSGDAAYDPRTRTAYARSGPAQNAAALRAVTRSLLDQHFRLSRLGRVRGRDARLAARAAFDGYAALSTRPVLGVRTPARSASRLGRFLELERGFGESVGLRFVSDLRNLGGSKVALGALRRLPATTEQVFHLDKYLEREPAVALALPPAAAGLKLRETGTFGELDVRALLAVFGVPRIDRAATGWGGGRTARYVGAGGEAIALVLSWDTALDAAQWAGAVPVYLRAAFGPEPSRPVAFERSGPRTALVVGPDQAHATALARALAGR